MAARPRTGELFATEPEPPPPGGFAQVALPRPVRREFTYHVPEPLEQRVRAGVRVAVPFGSLRQVGVVVRREPTTDLEAGRVRSIADVLASRGLDLDGWHLTEATGISSDGRFVVGTGVNPEGRTEAWLALLRGNVPCGPVYSVDEALADEHALARDMVIGIDHPTFGWLRQVGTPLKMAGVTPVHRRAPRLGEHTDEVLAEAGFAPAEIARLRADGVV